MLFSTVINIHCSAHLQYQFASSIVSPFYRSSWSWRTRHLLSLLLLHRKRDNLQRYNYVTYQFENECYCGHLSPHQVEKLGLEVLWVESGIPLNHKPNRQTSYVMYSTRMLQASIWNIKTAKRVSKSQYKQIKIYPYKTFLFINTVLQKNWKLKI